MGASCKPEKKPTKGKTIVKPNSKRIVDRFHTYDQLEKALRDGGLESSNLIVGVDFTRSNTNNGGYPYCQNENLHALGPNLNLYQQVIMIMGKTLEHFDDDNLIPTYGFGDLSTTDKSVFSFLRDPYTGEERPCNTFNEVLSVYSNIVSGIKMSGPTNFAPLIYKAIDIVKQTRSYHILLIVCDGQISNEADTTKAIVAASKYPLSIICVGVGKADFTMMEHFDDSIEDRDFDNFQFVNFYKVMKDCENEEVEFARHALMEVPSQFEYIKKHLL
jgi:hypothetical protein